MLNPVRVRILILRGIFLIRPLLSIVALAVAAILSLTTPGFGQGTAQSPIGPFGDGIVVPTATGVLDHKDAEALAEWSSHRGAVGSDPWKGMQGTGKITYGSQDSTAYDASLTNLAGDSFRLDAKTNKGEMSIRIHGRLGKTKGGDAVTPLPSDTAAAGLFPFERARLNRYTGAGTSLVDHGLTLISGTQLHRITLETPTLSRNPVTKSQETTATDFYFDPTSHLLVKTADSVQIVVGQRAKFLTVIMYGDYRKVGNSMIPFRYTETMDGQLYWTLQLSEVTLNPVLDATYFEF